MAHLNQLVAHHKAESRSMVPGGLPRQLQSSMPDTALYLHVKTIHHTSIALSLLLFTARWLGVSSVRTGP